MGELSGKRAVVTGGTRGIGMAIAKRFLDEGAEVLVSGRHLSGCGPDGAEYYGVDFTDVATVEKFAAILSERHVDVLVNNAGINIVAPFEQISNEDFDTIQQVNLKTPFRLSQAVLSGMRVRGWGRIVNVSSIFGKISKSFRASYSASKFALDGMTAALAAEVARDGVLVNCISPGFVNTELTRKVLGDEGIKAQVADVPLGRMGEPDEIASFVLWLAGPENTYISGQNIAIDGGFTRV